MLKIILSSIIILIFLNTSKSQETKNFLEEKKFTFNFLNTSLVKDTNDVQNKSKVQKVNIGGLFISPELGFSIPVKNFSGYSKSGVLYGVKFELAYSRFYPFIFGFVYEYQKNPGADVFKNENFLNQFDTKITSYGGSLDIILNKYIKSNFTKPIFSFEVKYFKVSRVISPDILIPGVTKDENLIAYSAGLGFTIYILDVGGKYTFAKDFSNLSFQMRFHFPIIKF